MDFITSEEKTMLQEKLAELRALDKQLIQRIAEARALGDLRENAEYHASREDKAMNDAKIKEIEDRIATAQVADASALPQDMVFVGATVRLRDEDRVVVRYVDNPNGSTDSIAGVCSEGRNVVGLMPHPERAIESVLGDRKSTRLNSSH